MGLEHAGEEMVRWAFKEGGAGGAFGVALGFWAGWPRPALERVGATAQTVPLYHNWWTHGEFKEVVIACVVGAGLMGVFFAALGGLLGPLLRRVISKGGRQRR